MIDDDYTNSTREGATKQTTTAPKRTQPEPPQNNLCAFVVQKITAMKGSIALAVALGSLEASTGFGIFRCQKMNSVKSHLHSSIISDAPSSINDELLVPLRSINRRKLIRTLLQAAIPGVAIMSSPKASEAACLSGDTSTECIGVYKLPLDDAVESFIDTPEHLAKMAPGESKSLKNTLSIVEPESYLKYQLYFHITEQQYRSKMGPTSPVPEKL